MIGKIIANIVGLNETLSMATNTKNTINVRPKFMTAETFLLSRNIYFGTLIFVNILALDIRDCMPPFVDSRKYENIRFPANRYVV